ncbi:hypothetical protein GW17_00062071 [Ensete ventricosum]|nr:hypothetical protein GW17_00062071 [Ensete ventricosum]
MLPCVGDAPARAAALAGGSTSCGAARCGLVVGNHPLRPGRGRCLCSHASHLQAPAMPAGGRACWRLPLQGAFAVADRPLTGGLGRNRLPLAAGLAVGGQPCMGVGRGWPPLLLAAFAAKTQQEHIKRFYAIQSHHTV